MKERYYRIPVFIPHLGCPHRCVFCDQRRISGRSSFDSRRVREEIGTALATVPVGAPCEIAFFGGSFTGIGVPLMKELLDTAQEFIDGGRADAVRLSTRPDYIDTGILSLLRSYSVREIELGIQSTDDRVLAASGRGHTAACSAAACRIIREAGFSLVGQMMTGLPEATPESERRTALDICEWGASGARIYPTVVLKNTELAEMAADGRYRPLSWEENISRAADVLSVFLSHGVKVLRIGLQSGEELSEETVAAGTYHPATGELVKGELYFRRITKAAASLPGTPAGKTLVVSVPRGALSCAIGWRGRNRRRLIGAFSPARILFREEDGIEPFACRVAAE